MKNVLITGGAGFIGSNLSLKLIEKGFKVTVLDNLSPQIHGLDPQNTSPLYRSIQDKVKFIQGTVTSKEDWMTAIEGQDIIVHFAAETGTGQSMYCIEKYTDVNIQGTSLLLDLLVSQPKCSIEKIIVASSRSIYGEGKYIHPEYGPVYPNHRRENDMINGDFEVKYKNNQPLDLIATDEEAKIHPSSVYGITKQVQEQLIMTVCPTIGIAPIAFRYQNVYGPGQSLSNPYTGILSIFSTQIRNQNNINIFEDGKESRDFVYIDDVVDATVLGIEDNAANGHIFNVGSGIAINVKSVAEALIEVYGIDVPIEITKQFRIGDIRHNFADLTKIGDILKFKPMVKFKDGINKFAEWVLTQEIQEDKLSKSLEEMKKKGLLK